MNQQEIPSRTREQFESFVKAKGCSVMKNPIGDYIESMTCLWWQAWKAATDQAAGNMEGATLQQLAEAILDNQDAGAVIVAVFSCDSTEKVVVLDETNTLPTHVTSWIRSEQLKIAQARAFKAQLELFSQLCEHLDNNPENVIRSESVFHLAIREALKSAPSALNL